MVKVLFLSFFLLGDARCGVDVERQSTNEGRAALFIVPFDWHLNYKQKKSEQRAARPAWALMAASTSTAAINRRWAGSALGVASDVS